MGLIIRSSAIHAAGCYTTAPIAKGTRLIEYTGPRLNKERADELYEMKPYTYLFGLGDGETVIDGHCMAMFINHSCNPNCEAEEDENARIWISAIRDIAAEEELTYDYQLYDGEGEEPCFCGARHCRGTMYSREEEQKQYSSASARLQKNKSGAGKKQNPAPRRQRVAAGIEKREETQNIHRRGRRRHMEENISASAAD